MEGVKKKLEDGINWTIQLGVVPWNPSWRQPLRPFSGAKKILVDDWWLSLSIWICGKSTLQCGPPPSDVRWFINPMNYSYRYHKPVRDIGVINAPTERKFVNGGSFHSLNASWDRSSGHREKRSGIHQRKSWVTVWKSCVSLIPGRVIIIL